MLSWPPATTILASPSAICWAASATARRPEPQSWFRLQAGLSTGMPALTDGLAGRALAGAGLQHLAQDHLVDVGGGDAGALQRRLDGDLAQLRGPAGWTGAPWKEPTGVRAAETMTMSVMDDRSWHSSRCVK